MLQVLITPETQAMKKLSYLLAVIFLMSGAAFAEESKAPQDQAGKAAPSAADNIGNSAKQLGSDAVKGSGNIVNSVGKFLQELGHKLSGDASTPVQPTSAQSSAPPSTPSSAQQSETLSPPKK